MVTRLFASPPFAAQPAWGLTWLALGGLALGLTLVAGALLRFQQQPVGAGCAMLAGIFLTPLSLLALVWALNLAGGLGR